MSQATLGSCALCGHFDGTVKLGLAWFSERLEEFGMKLVESIDRCTDHVACRDRREVQGQAWPIDDATEARRFLLTGETARAHADRVRPVNSEPALP